MISENFVSSSLMCLIQKNLYKTKFKLWKSITIQKTSKSTNCLRLRTISSLSSI